MTPEEEKEEETGYLEILIRCPFCRAYVPDDFQCIECGAEILNADETEYYEMICSECQGEVEDEPEECPHCSVELVY